MNSAHLAAVSLSLLIYAGLAVAYFGWGKTIFHLLGFTADATPSITVRIWLGWAITLWVFQVAHLFFPLTAHVVFPVFILGIVFSLPQLPRAWRIFRQNTSMPALLISIGVGGAVLIFIAWIASRSMLHPKEYDTGLYYLNIIRWLNSYSIVPGLGNLHGRLAFNNAIFPYVAALNFEPFFGHGRTIANSFLFLLAIATQIELLHPAIKKPSLLIKSHPFKYLPALLSFPPLLYLSLASKDLASPGHGLTSTILQLVMFVLLANSLGEWFRKKREQHQMAMLLAVLATTAVTVKLSNLGISTSIILFVLLYAWRHRAIPLFGRIFALCTLIMLVWCSRGVLLSGLPLFPSTVGYIPVDWAVPEEIPVNLAQGTYANARMGKVVVDRSLVLGKWDWFGPWLERIVSKYTAEIAFPFALSVTLGILAALGFFKQWKQAKSWEWTILVPSLFGLSFWFFTAPNPRYAHALFYIIAIASMVFFISSIQRISNKRLLLIVICTVGVVSNLNFAYSIKNNLWRAGFFSKSGVHPIKEVPLLTRVTSSGLTVYTPQNGDQSWQAPLPATPYFKTDLRLRDPQDMSSGFTLKKQQE